MASQIFKNEQKVKKIGGRLERDYYEFRNRVLSLNDNIIPLFILLGFTLRDKESIIEAILTENPTKAASSLYISHFTELIEAGKIKLEKVLTSRMMKKIAEATPEEAERLRKREVHRSLVTRLKKIFKKYEKEYKPSRLYFNPESLKILQGALNLCPTGLEINVDKFIELYGSFLDADGSDTRKKHQEAADSINRFFQGAVEIPQTELGRYFRLDYGVVKPNPKSINRESYLRLGYGFKEEPEEK